MCGKLLTAAYRGVYVCCDRPAGHEREGVPHGWREYVQPAGADHPAMSC